MLKTFWGCIHRNEQRTELVQRRLLPLLVLQRGARREPPAVAPHDLVNDEHARRRRVFGDDVGEEDGALLRGSLRTCNTERTCTCWHS